MKALVEESEPGVKPKPYFLCLKSVKNWGTKAESALYRISLG